MATKTLRSEVHDFVERFEIRNAGTKVKFYDWYTHRTLVRTVWKDCALNMFVFVNGRFLSLSMSVMTDSGIPFTINEYVEC